MGIWFEMCKVWVVTTAIAREMVGFLWAIARQVRITANA